MASYIRKTICPYDCPTSCGLLAETDGIRILGVKGDPDHPAAKGLICRKMQHYEQSVHSPERILTPMKRVGAKGEGRFEPITWDAAVEEIAGRWSRILEEDGADAILPMYYSGVMSVLQRKCGDAFFNRMGACDMVRTLCSSAKGAGYEAVMGQTGCLDPRELSDSSFYLVWGSNMKATRLQSMPALIRARRQGKRVVLIESCAADMDVYCDQTILIRPGTDGALALAMMHVMEEENLADRDFLTRQAEGYDPCLGGKGDRHTRRGNRGSGKGICLCPGSGHHSGKRSLPLWKRRNDHTPNHHFVCLYRRLGASRGRLVRL